MKRYIRSNNNIDRLTQRYKYKGYDIEQCNDERFPFRVFNVPEGPGYADFHTYQEAKRYIDSLEIR